jgi:hypothetical protein
MEFSQWCENGVIANSQFKPSWLTAGVLPLGGDKFVQLSALLLIGVAADELLTRSGRKK